MNKSFLITGSGGQGILSIGAILASIFMLDDLYVTYTSSYGAEMRGGAVNCEITVSDKEINSLFNKKVDCLIALNQESFDKFNSRVKKEGTIIANSSLVDKKNIKEEVKNVFLPFSEKASLLGNIKMTNSIALGILANILGGFDIEKVKKAYQKVLSNKIELIEKNIEAYMLGFNCIQEEKE